MTTTYTPREGSAPYKVIAFLTANPDEQLDADLISAKCDCDRRSVHTLLSSAVQAGLLQRSEEPTTGELVYTLGTGTPLKSPAVGGFHAWPAPAKSAIGTAMKAYKDTTGKVLASRKVEGGIRVWRVS